MKTKLDSKKKLKTKVKEKVISGSELIIRTLIKLGIKIDFGYPEGVRISLDEIIYQYHRFGYFNHYFNHILNHHKQEAILAIEGYPQATGAPGVCFTGQVATPFIGSDVFHELDIIGITALITKQISQTANIKEIFYVGEKAVVDALNNGCYTKDIKEDNYLSCSQMGEAIVKRI